MSDEDDTLDGDDGSDEKAASGDREAASGDGEAASGDGETASGDGETASGDGENASGDGENASGDEPFDGRRDPSGSREVREPFATLLEDVDASDEAWEEVFEEMDVGDLDSEALWEAVVEGHIDAEDVAGAGGAPEELPGEVTPFEEREEPAGLEHLVDKREFCHRCPYFGEPPETECTHEGTEILAVVDAGRFRVRDCPMVGEPGRTSYEPVEPEAEEAAGEGSAAADGD